MPATDQLYDVHSDYETDVNTCQAGDNEMVAVNWLPQWESL